MQIKSIVIGGEKGDIEITRASARGAIITSGGEVVCEYTAADDADDRWAKAERAAVALYGARGGRPCATNSMVHEVLEQIERVGGF